MFQKKKKFNFKIQCHVRFLGGKAPQCFSEEIINKNEMV